MNEKIAIVVRPGTDVHGSYFEVKDFGPYTNEFTYNNGKKTISVYGIRNYKLLDGCLEYVKGLYSDKFITNKQLIDEFKNINVTLPGQDSPKIYNPLVLCLYEYMTIDEMEKRC